MIRILNPAAVLMLLVCIGTVASGHESRPAYLEINETIPGRYDVLWRTPVNAGMRLPVALRFPESVRNVTAPTTSEFPDCLVERRLIEISGGLGGQRVEFVGLQATITDVLVRVQYANGARATLLVHPSQPWIEISQSQGRLSVAGTFVVLGIRHISLGVDHLLFVLGLVLLVKKRWMLFKTVTAFTVAHSITLAAATLGFVHVPGPPVEACIALSIVFVALEILRGHEGKPGLTERAPWVIAFTFGLLHGLGFAGALTQVGLPQQAIPLALFFFNVGVELGQLAFIAVVLGLTAAARRLPIKVPVWSWRVPPYAIGSVAMFWVIQRIAAF